MIHTMSLQDESRHIETIQLNVEGGSMEIRRFALPIKYSLIGVVLMGAGPTRALPQDNHTHTAVSQGHEQSSERNDQAERTA